MWVSVIKGSGGEGGGGNRGNRTTPPPIVSSPRGLAPSQWGFVTAGGWTPYANWKRGSGGGGEGGGNNSGSDLPGSTTPDRFKSVEDAARVGNNTNFLNLVGIGADKFYQAVKKIGTDFFEQVINSGIDFTVEFMPGNFITDIYNDWMSTEITVQLLGVFIEPYADQPAKILINMDLLGPQSYTYESSDAFLGLIEQYDFWELYMVIVHEFEHFLEYFQGVDPNRLRSCQEIEIGPIKKTNIFRLKNGDLPRQIP